MSLNPSSSCFFPPDQASPLPRSTCSDEEEAQLTTAQAEGKKSGTKDEKPSTKEKFHAGRSKWGKYKKKEKEDRSRRPVKQPIETNAKSGGFCDTPTKESFDFPDGGWVCCVCQNYNFQGRVRCNRCEKVKSTQDQEGKPKHLIRHQHKDGQKRSGTSPAKKATDKALKLDKQNKVRSIETAALQVSIESKNQILDESLARAPQPDNKPQV